MSTADGTRRSLVRWLADVVGAKYREAGLSGIATAAPRFVYEDFLAERLRWYALMAPIRPGLVDRETLLREGAAADALWHAGEAETVVVDAPDGVDLPAPLSAWVGRYSADRPFVCERRDGRLVGPKPVAVDDGRVLLEAASASEMYLFFQLSLLYDGLATGRSRLAAYRRYRAVLDGRERLVRAGDGDGLTTAPVGRPDAPAGRPSAAPATLAAETRAVGRGGGHDTADSSGAGAATPSDPAPLTDADADRPLVPMIPYWMNYYHWTMEFLPKLRVLERYREATGRSPTLLLRADPPRWSLATLELAGWDLDDCRTWPDTEARVDRLLVPLHRNRYIAPHDGTFADDFTPSPGDCRWLAGRMQSNVDLDAGPDFGDRIYVSRRDTTFRPVANEGAVSEALADRGFETYALGELALPDQIRLLAGADVVVAPHGAGLTNLIHANDATVVECFPADKVEPYYFCLSRALGFDYRCRVYPVHDDAMHVDVPDLVDAVDAVL